MLMEKRIFFFASKLMDKEKRNVDSRTGEKARIGRVLCTQKFRFWCLTMIIIIFDTPRHTTTN